jgi:hypothetical protein
VRVLVALLAAALLTAGCSGSSHPEASHEKSSVGGTLQALWARPGQNVSMVEGTSDYSTGLNRVSFLVLARNGKSIERPSARIWVSRGLKERPFEQTRAAFEPIGVPGGYEAGHDITHLYVAHVRLPRPGKYWILAEPVGGRPIQAVGNLVVRPRTLSPAIGSKAYPSNTPTLASEHGNLSKLTTRVPPDRELLGYSIADSLAVHKPFVVVFATPKFCTSRTCGPVVDVVNSVRKRFARRDVRFIHVEIYKDNDPTKGFNRWVKEWDLPTEPWVFLVGSDGRITAKFEGSVSAGELATAIRRRLD